MKKIKFRKRMNGTRGAQIAKKTKQKKRTGIGIKKTMKMRKWAKVKTISMKKITMNNFLTIGNNQMQTEYLK